MNFIRIQDTIKRVDEIGQVIRSGSRIKIFPPSRHWAADTVSGLAKLDKDYQFFDFEDEASAQKALNRIEVALTNL